MKPFNLGIFIVFFVTFSHAQIDSLLSKKIDSLKTEDQKWRNLIREAHNGLPSIYTLKDLENKMTVTDSLHYFILKDIFYNYGYPGFDKVGNKSSHNFWLLMQHQDSQVEFQIEVLNAMLKEVEKQNASGSDYAYLIDRVKVNRGELQVYGTQMQINVDSTSYEPKPVIDPQKLDERRKEVFLPPMKHYIGIMNERNHGRLKKK